MVCAPPWVEPEVSSPLVPEDASSGALDVDASALADDVGVGPDVDDVDDVDDVAPEVPLAPSRLPLGSQAWQSTSAKRRTGVRRVLVSETMARGI